VQLVHPVDELNNSKDRVQTGEGGLGAGEASSADYLHAPAIAGEPFIASTDGANSITVRALGDAMLF
jgi:hypothetical protein